MNIKKDTTFIRFLRQKNRRPNTKTRLTTSMKQYCEFIEKTPTKLIKEAEHEQISYIEEINGKQLIIEPSVEETNLAKYFYDFYEHLKNQGKKQNTILGRFRDIKTFYNSFENIKKIPKTDYLKTKTRTKRNKLSKKKIIRAIETAKETRDKALITFMASTGMRSGDVRRLKIIDLLKALNINTIDELLEKKDNLIGYWDFTPEKTPLNICQTCNTAESTKYIIKFLKEKTEYADLHHESTIFSSLYTSEMISNTGFIRIFKSIDEKLYREEIKQLKQDLKKEKISHYEYEKKKNEIPKFHAHALRSFFITTASSHSGNLRILSTMSGHRLPGKTDENYVKFDKKTIINEYMRFIKYLSFEKTKVNEITIEDKKKLIEMERENKELSERISILESKENKKNKAEILVGKLSDNQLEKMIEFLENNN